MKPEIQTPANADPSPAGQCGSLSVIAGSPLRSLRESLDRDQPTTREAELLLKALSWNVDMVITNYDGERVWLGPCLNAEGRRIGITDCCPESAPCEHHRKIALANGVVRDAHREKSQ